MGRFVGKGQKIWEWRYDLGGSRLYHIKGAGMDIYAPPPRTGEVRRPNRWTQESTILKDPLKLGALGCPEEYLS